MEEVLDAVSNGETSRLDSLESFYRGGRGGIDFPGLVALLDVSGEIDAREISAFPVDGSGALLRVGRYGPYLDRDGDRANVPDDLPPDELTAEKVDELFARPSGDHPLGTDPETGRQVVAKDGRYGPYVTEVLGEDEPTTGKNAVKPRTASLFATMSLDTVTLEDALRLLTLPRVVGADADGHDITALNGRYGPYLSKDGETRSLESEEQLFTVTVDEALALFAAPKARRGQARAAAAVLKELGDDPVSGKPVTLREGRFGPYVTDGEINASLRRDDDADTLTPQRAAELLADKRAKGPAPRKRTAKKTTAKKTTAKKTTAKKTTAKKTTAKKTTAKKTTAKKTTAKKTTAKKTTAGQAPAPGA
jgi:DNA topoisomerase-1